MTRPSTADKRRTFRKLHDSGCFVIPNPWNIGSARYLQGLGFKALATTSSGAAHAQGTRAPGYLLDSRGVEFDVHRFTGHTLAGQKALSRADPERAVSEFDTALGLWRGQAYADMRDTAWAAPEASRLEELRLSVVETRCAAQLALGHHHGTVAELDMHVRAHPLREHGCELLAVALYRAGRQAEALGVLRATRALLAQELGIDPGAALRRLERDILTQAPTLEWQPPRAPSTAHTTGSPASPQVLTKDGTSALLPAEEQGMGVASGWCPPRYRALRK